MNRTRLNMNICRLCLYQGDEKQILSVWDCDVEDLPNKIWTCVSVNITKTDELPTTACLSCIHQVTQWIIFRETCEKSNTILLNNFTERNFNKNDPLIKYIDKLAFDEEETTIQSKTKNARQNKCNIDEPYFDKSSYDLKYKFGNPHCEYICDICKSEFETCLDYLDHQIEHNGYPVFECDKCGEVFDSREKIVKHEKSHRKPCPECGKMVLQTSMKLHLVKHTDRHRCTECPRRFNSRAILTQHIITVHTNIKNHMCDTCGKGFSSPTALHVHMRSHSDERLYKCKLCSYAGRTASALYIHKSTHANDMCICEVCSKTFKSIRNLNDHLRRVHSKIKKYECNYCKKKFVDKYMLNVHIRCHTGIRPYKCTVCNKAFMRSDGLKEHIATHGQRNLFDCKDCGKKFKSKRGITRHTYLCNRRENQ